MKTNLYNEYLNLPRSLAIETMKGMHEQLVEEVGEDVDAIELYKDFADSATKYAAVRASWMTLSSKEKMDQDKLRTSYHNSLIVRINVLARHLRTKGKAVEWRNLLGDEEEDNFCRKTIGDFGCYVVFVHSLMAR